MLHYVLATRKNETVHATASSTGTADKKTILKPTVANGMFLSAKAFNVRVTFDGTDPGAGVAPGLIIIAGAQPIFFPFATDIEFVSDIAGTSELNVLYIEAVS